MSKQKAETFIDKILLTVMGGVGLFIAAAVLNSMFSAPVSSADFDKHKAEATGQLRSINDKLSTLKEGQTRLLEHILK